MKFVLILMTAAVVSPCIAQDAGPNRFSGQSIPQRNSEYQWSQQSNRDQPKADIFGRETPSERLTNAWGQEVPNRP